MTTTPAWISSDPLEESDVDDLEANPRTSPAATTPPPPAAALEILT
jgi:hypothetical protein